MLRPRPTPGRIPPSFSTSSSVFSLSTSTSRPAILPPEFSLATDRHASERGRYDRRRMRASARSAHPHVALLTCQLTERANLSEGLAKKTHRRPFGEQFHPQRFFTESLAGSETLGPTWKPSQHFRKRSSVRFAHMRRRLLGHGLKGRHFSASSPSSFRPGSQWNLPSRFRAKGTSARRAADVPVNRMGPPLARLSSTPASPPPTKKRRNAFYSVPPFPSEIFRVSYGIRKTSAVATPPSTIAARSVNGIGFHIYGAQLPGR